MVDKAGIYQLPLMEYVNDPAPEPSVNSGIALALLTQSPKHAWMHHPRLNLGYESEQSSRMDLGTIAHALLLEGDDSRIVVVEAEDWRTKAAKEQRDNARLAGKLPILSVDYVDVVAMVGIANTAIANSEIASDWKGGISEESLIWQESGVWCRSRPDRHSADWRVIFDYKTAAGSASPAAFTKAIINNGYDLQAALGIRGVKALKQIDQVLFVFVVQEIEPPYSVSFVGMSPQFIAVAEQRLAYAQDRWGKCLATNQWPGYPSRVAYVEPPGYYGMETYESIDSQ